ncbi:MAG: hypothetical protein IJ302_03755, partial [Clostridia bacterium]|nr:hypothetical protein [Clostridia bacterium]
MKTKLLASVLALLMLASSFTACSESNAGTNTDETNPAGGNESVSTDTSVPEEELTDLEKRQLIPDDLPDVTFNGEEFRAFTSNASHADYEGEFVAEEITGDACNDAVYNRNIK